MKNRFLHLVALGCFLLSAHVIAAAFTAGNVVIYRVGDGSSALSSAATAVFLDEFTPSGSLVQSIAVPTSISGSNLSLVASGSTTSEGFISLSANGACALLTGYNAPVGTSSIATTTAASSARVIGVAYANGSLDTSTSVANFSAGSIRTAASTDCLDLWAAGSTDGLRHVIKGVTGATATQVSGATTNIRQVNIFAGQLYISTASGALRLGTVGTGTPTTTGQSITNLPGLSTNTGSPYSFFFADLSGGVAGVDTLYVADDAAGLFKYSLVGGSWTANGNINTPLRGLTGKLSGGSLTLYATSASGFANTLLQLTDSSGYNGSLTGSLSLLATAGVNTRFAGVALVPLAATCTPGSYSATGNQPCTLAQAGFYVPTSGALLQTACAPGAFQANTGSVSCNPAQAGNYVAVSAATAQTQCAIGSYQPATGQTSCLIASAGNFVNVLGAISQTQCAAGSFQSLTGAAGCNPAQAGNYVAVSAATAQTQCAIGSYQAATAQVSCLLASAGNFVNVQGAISQTQCAAGSFQPATGQASCTLAQTGFYVPVTGAIAQTPCVLGTTSNAGAFVCVGLPLLNIDASDAATTYDAATDGVLLLRYLFGLRGAALIRNARGGGPSLRDATQIETHIATYLTLFDVDGDGQTFATTDGLMIVRRLLGLSGTALTANAKRGSASDAAIELAIDALRP